jgi:hypothetical protein
MGVVMEGPDRRPVSTQQWETATEICHTYKYITQCLLVLSGHLFLVRFSFFNFLPLKILYRLSTYF